jgi:hypothetical protein
LNFYIRTAIEAYADYKIFETMSESFETNNPNNPLEVNPPTPYRGTILTGYHSFVIFSALSYESYANLFGNIALAEGFHEKYLDRLSVLKKISAALKIAFNMDVDLGSEPFQTIKKIFAMRDKIVHDKGVEVNTKADYINNQHRRMIDLEDEQVLRSFILFNEYLEKVGCDILFLTELNIEPINSWLTTSENMLCVDDGLLFSGAAFPSLIEYRHAVRRHTGFLPTNVYLNEERRAITSIKSNSHAGEKMPNPD